jgi:hypothetical protein
LVVEPDDQDREILVQSPEVDREIRRQGRLGHAALVARDGEHPKAALSRFGGRFLERMPAQPVDHRAQRRTPLLGFGGRLCSTPLVHLTG